MNTEYLQSGKSLSPLEALNMFNCLRLGARISDLRKEGHNIQTTYNKKGKRYAKYILIH
ncbi:helix-turn-helix domain-containing protein [Sphingobacterium multivorum]|uniref:helix-turn-helix domain-containing protein n=1 Tax=Sphingobacterium multivorum TaxID=28454 RepID=UPI003DA60855